jgi:methylated-DNA-protein-cysteine methyltransferase-like protein
LKWTASASPSSKTRLDAEELFSRFYEAIRQVPRGRVATYGQIAATAGLPRHARFVGRALRSLPERSDVPWHRIVNAAGQVSRRPSDSDQLQRFLLEGEGIEFDRAGRISLEEFRWEDPADRPSGRYDEDR